MTPDPAWDDWLEQRARERRRRLGPRPSLAALDRAIRDLAWCGEGALGALRLEREWLAEHPGAHHAPPAERLHDAPFLGVLVSTCGPANQFVTPRSMHLHEFAEWWRGQAWWVVAAEVAAFEADAERERSPRIPHRETFELVEAIHELGTAPERLDWVCTWGCWKHSGADPEVLEALAVIGLHHGWLDDGEYRATKRDRWLRG